jgi:hypothetical protein
VLQKSRAKEIFVDLYLHFTKNNLTTLSAVADPTLDYSKNNKPATSGSVYAKLQQQQ